MLCLRCWNAHLYNLYLYLYITKKLKSNIYYCYTLVEPHQQPCHLFIFYIFFSLFKLFIPYFQKKKKKTILLPISSHTYYYTFPNISFFFLHLYLPITLPLYFLPLFYIWTLLLPILSYINLISLSYLIHIFPTQNHKCSLSLSLSLSVNFCSFL